MDRRDLGDYAAARPLAERSVAIAEARAGVETSRGRQEPAHAGHDLRGAWRLFRGDAVVRARDQNQRGGAATRRSGAARSLMVHPRFCFPSRGTAPTTWTCSSRYSRLARTARSRRSPHGGKPEQPGRDCCPPRTTSRRTRPLFERALESQERSWGRSILRLERPPPISRICSRGPATAKRPRDSTSAPWSSGRSRWVRVTRGWRPAW